MPSSQVGSHIDPEMNLSRFLDADGTCPPCTAFMEADVDAARQVRCCSVSVIQAQIAERERQRDEQKRGADSSAETAQLNLYHLFLDGYTTSSRTPSRKIK